MFNGPVFNNETIQSNARAVNGGGISESLDEANALYSRLTGASFELVPSSFGRGVLYSGAPGANGDLSWTRGSDAFRTNASGVIQRVPWNLLQQSETFENSYWIKGSSSISANNTTSPNGTSTADKLVEDNTTSSKFIYTSTTTSQTGTIYTYSIYAKAGERSWAIIGQNVIGTGYFWVDLSNGVFGSTSGTYISRSIESVGNGWYRISITYSSINSSSVGGIYITSGNNVVSYTGNGTSGLYIWGAQLVEGTTAQTYLPTTDRLNFPRLSYMYGSCPAALLEPQRTNLALYSEQFENSVWAQGGPTTVTANTTTSPDGTTNADTATFNSTTAYLREAIFSSLTNGSTYTLSVYAKASASSGASNVRLTVNNTLTWTGAASTKVALTSSWQRITLTWTANGTAAYFILGAIDGTGAMDSTCYGNVDLYGAQLELGAYATTIIPTTSATATRVADSFSRNNIYTNGLISASGGTWFVELRNNIGYTRDNVGNHLILSDTSLTNFFRLRNDGTPNTRLRIQKNVSGVGGDLFLTTTNTVKIAIKWNGTTADVFVNGVKEVSATSFTATQLQDLASNPQLPAFIQSMALYPTPLSDADCASLTADYTDGTSIVGNYERYVSQRSGAVENLSGVTNLIQNLK